MSQRPGSGTVLGPFTARETTFLAGCLALALAALVSFGRSGGDFAVVVLALAAPVAVGAGFAWRRVRERSRADLLSFSLDQLGAAAGVVGLVVALGGMGGAGSFSQFLGILGALAMIVATLGIGWIGRFREDFALTPDMPWLRRDVLTADDAAWTTTQRDGGTTPGGGAQRAGEDAPGAAPGSGWTAGSGGTGAPGTGASAPGGPEHGSSAGSGGARAPRVPHTGVTASAGRPVRPTPFWFAVPDSRPALNRITGRTEFVVEPGLWWLAVRELPAGGLVVRHDDGREGLLGDTGDLEIG